MEPTERNLRAFEEAHRRAPASAGEPGLPDHIRARLHDLGGVRVLHLLCGAGAATRDLVELGALVTPVDESEEALAVARTAYPDLPWIHADPHALPPELMLSRFDLVVVGALGRVRDLDALCASAAGALRPGGELLLWDEHPAARCLDAFGRWRASYFGGRTLGRLVNAVASSGLVVLRLEELAEEHDERIPGELVLVAEKPR